MEYRKYFFLFLVTLTCFLPCARPFAQQTSGDSLRLARQRTADSARNAQKAAGDSMRVERQRVLDSTHRVMQHRTDSLAAVRKYKESNHYKDSVTRSRQAVLDSTRKVRTQFFDSLKAVRKQSLDSTTQARKLQTDSLQKRQKIRSDSLTRIRKYKESKHYIDSVGRARNQHIDSIRNGRTQFFDSVKTERKRVLDSALTSRKHITDSVQKRQKIRGDSLAVIRKYKESKRYSDSVAVKRQAFSDSLRFIRKHISDSLMTKRKQFADSSKASRKHISDSTMAIRSRVMDSMKVVRQKRADSMAKVKEQRAKDAKAKVKKMEEKQKLSLELKIAKKHKAFSNEQMLKKKWSFVRRSFQNMFTRFNYYFNAKRKMQEANMNMVRRKKDNFDHFIDLFPFDPNVDSTAFSADMDSIVRKASVGLQIHDPRTKWADDLYLLMGQAYYYKGNYDQAEVTFRYIIGMRNRNLNKKKKKTNTSAKKTTDNSLVEKEKSKFVRFFKHKPAHNDAVLWLARTYSDSKRQAESEAILDLLDGSTQLSEAMKAKIALEKANLMIRRGGYHEASEQLTLVSHSKAISKYTRERAAFLNGQLLQTTGDYAASAASFKTALDLHPEIEMDFYARKEMATSLMLAGDNQDNAIASLKKVLKDGKYAPYQEQVYYLLGRLSANNNNMDEALDYFNKSLRLPKTSKKQKALTFAAVGNLQYAAGNYNAAKRAFDSASYFAKYAPESEEVLAAIRKGKSLDKVEDPYAAVHTQDSLLYLSSLSEKDQRSAVRKYLKYLEKLRADSILAAQMPATPDPSASASGSGTSNWYFASPVAVQQGFNDFKRKWGSRPLTDNWRRSAASSFGGGAAIDSSALAGDDDQEDDDGLPTEASLMAGIPKTPQQIEAARKKLRSGYIALADAYITDLEDYKSGLSTLDTLDARFPDHEFGDQAMYLRYLTALRQNKIEEAQQIGNKLVSTYPDSKWAKVVHPDEDASNNSALPDNVTVAEYYEITYTLAMDRRYDEVLQRIGAAKKHFGDVSYARKFRILEAMALAGTGQYNKADTAVVQYLKEYPADSLKGWAEAIARYVKEKRATDTLGNAIAAATDSLASAAKIKSDSMAAAKALAPDKFVYKANEAHYTLFLFGKPDVKVSGFKSGLSDFSTFKFGTMGLTTKLEMLNGDQSMVVTRQFGNAAQAKIFAKSASAEKLLFRDIPAGSFQVFIISESNYLKLITDKNITDYSTFYKKNYK